MTAARDSLLERIRAAIKAAQDAGYAQAQAEIEVELAEDRARARREEVHALLAELAALGPDDAPPLPMVMHCPKCSAQHVDEGEFETIPHRAHLCASCGHTWQPCARPTVGVRSLEEGTRP